MHGACVKLNSKKELLAKDREQDDHGGLSFPHPPLPIIPELISYYKVNFISHTPHMTIKKTCTNYVNRVVHTNRVTQIFSCLITIFHEFSS
jgi:hypothetical protein